MNHSNTGSTELHSHFNQIFNPTQATSFKSWKSKTELIEFLGILESPQFTLSCLTTNYTVIDGSFNLQRYLYIFNPDELYACCIPADLDLFSSSVVSTLDESACYARACYVLREVFWR